MGNKCDVKVLRDQNGQVEDVENLVMNATMRADDYNKNRPSGNNPGTGETTPGVSNNRGQRQSEEKELGE